MTTHRRSRAVFISGPYSGNEDENVMQALATASTLVDLGLEPYIPHLSHFWDAVDPHDYEYWMERCLFWVGRCDAVLRLPGESVGADREVTRANFLGIPAFNSIAALLLWAYE